MTLAEENAALRERKSLGIWADPKRVQQLIEMVNKGFSGSEIAKVLGLTRNQVVAKAWRMDLKMGMNEAASPLARARHGLYNPPTPRKTQPQTSTPRQKAKPMSPEPPKPTLAKPWEERGPRECSWLLTDEHPWIACCAPVEKRGWCSFHAEKGLIPPRVHRRAEQAA